jgi:hypothetical protein
MTASSHENRLVTIDRFYHPTEAHIAAGRLEAEGIPVHLFGIHHASMNWLLSTALGGIQLKVPASLADEARRILEAEASIESPEAVCPNCQSADTSSRSALWRVSFLATNLFQIPLPWVKSERRCESCGHGWIPGQEDEA